ncbi:MAG: glycosyltransferase family 2 protein [candidate division Zixibacteria bacterium]|nr:glycosyltransferase family 2 protein [candidate division Zixibacteria bacterium]
MVPVYPLKRLYPMTLHTHRSLPVSTDSPSPLPDISVCIVNWNTRTLIDRCLHSLYTTHQTPSFEVIVVDNGSQDGSPLWIAENYPQTILIENTENRGFGSANNQALRESRGRYCLLLNSDTLVFDETLDALIAFMDAHPDAGVATGQVFKTSDRTDRVISYAPTAPSPGVLFFNDLISLTGLKKLFPNSTLVERWAWIGRNLEKEQQVENVTGAFMAVRRTAMEQVGLFDEAIFMYMEESDWCCRFLDAGWKIYYTPSMSIVHLCEGSSRMRSDRDRLYYRSLAYFFRKHYGWTGWLTYMLQEYLLLRWLRFFHRRWLRLRTR